MPDPRGAKRLPSIGCSIKFKKTKIEVPVEVKNYDDYMPGTRYPKSIKREVWLVYIEMPNDLMDDIKEGSIDLAGQQIDLQELEDAYAEDLDKEDSGEEQDQQEDMAAGAPSAPAAATPPV